MELEKVCFHCNYFLMEVGVENLGVCMLDEAFLPFEEEIYDSGNFDCCYELYLKKRYDGNQEGCLQYQEAEIIEITEITEEDEDEVINGYMNRQMDDILEKLSGSDRSVINNVVNTLYTYICFYNESAYQGLLDYFYRLPAAEELEDVHTRVRIVDALAKRKEPETVAVLINELKRTPSNNVTRQLYTKILKILRSFPKELILEPVGKLLAEKKFSYRIKKRIEELLEPDKEFWFSN